MESYPEDDGEDSPPVKYPPQLSAATNASTWIGLLNWLFDISTIVVAACAFVGAKKDEDKTGVLDNVWISWTSSAKKIQAAEIAMGAIGFIWDNVLFQDTSESIGTLYERFTTPNARRVRKHFVKRQIPSHTLFLLAWILLVVYQAQYVPILGRTALPECAEFGTRLWQCRMVNGTWISAIVSCIFHFTLLLIKLELYRRLFYPDENEWPVPPVERVREVPLPTPFTVNGAPTQPRPASVRSVRSDSASDIIIGGPSKIE